MSSWGDRQLLQRILKVIVIAFLLLLLLLCRVLVWRLILKVQLRTTINSRGKIGHIPNTHRVKYHSYYQTTAGTGGDILTVCELPSRYFKAITTRTWVVVNAFFFIPGHVFYFYFIVVCAHDVKLYVRLWRGRSRSH